MARVCVEWFPENDGFYMDDRLKMQIDVLLKNIINDWDFTIIITGQGEVRVGKSMLAMQIACYWAYQIEKLYGKKVPFNLEQNFVFEGKKLIEIGNKLGVNYPYSPLIFDEAGADLEGKKIMSGSTQDVLDYFRECGQYNMLNVLVLPEYFDLPKGIAISRSIFLIDVFYTADESGIFKRGCFNFYSRRSKKYLYLFGKRDLNYSVVHSDFGKVAGRFYKFYTIDKKEYEAAKVDALKRRESRKRNKFQMQRDAAWYLLSYEGLHCHCGQDMKLTQKNLAKRMEQLTGIYVDRTVISDGMRHFLSEDEMTDMKNKQKGEEKDE